MTDKHVEAIEPTEDTTPIEAPVANATPEPAPDTEPGNDTHVEPDTNNKAAREAAKYRTRLREVETERDQLQAHLDAARQQIISGHLTDVEKAVLNLTQQPVSEFFTDDGNIDIERLSEVQKQWRVDHHALFVERAKKVPDTWSRPERVTPPTTFMDAFHPKP